MGAEPPLWQVILAFIVTAAIPAYAVWLGERHRLGHPPAPPHVEPEVDPTRDEHVAFPDEVPLPQASAPPLPIPRLDVPPVVHDEVMKVTYVRRGDLP